MSLYRRPLVGPFVLSIANQACPRCGSAMTLGAPHSPCTRQWECHRCGLILQE